MSPDARGLIPAGTSVLPPSKDTVFARIQRVRSMASRVHLLEPVVTLAAIILGTALALGLAWTWIAYAHSDASLSNPFGSGQAIPVQQALNALMVALGWIGVTLVAVIAASASRSSARPFGVVWDIMCYLPRTGHPFGPPAYAERAVPEIAGRLFDWLSGHPERRAVLVGHSMGAVLCVSALALLGSSPKTSGVLPQIRLLTFGAQLRVFFGRMFPELHGPAVLDTDPSHAPILRGPDPWARDFDTDPAPRPSADGRIGRLRGTLLPGTGVLWANLWRASDMLGWPVKSAHPNLVDRYAEELDVSGYMATVGGHSAYYRVPAYARALDDLKKP